MPAHFYLLFYLHLHTHTLFHTLSLSTFCRSFIIYYRWYRLDSTCIHFALMKNYKRRRKKIPHIFPPPPYRSCSESRSNILYMHTPVYAHRLQEKKKKTKVLKIEFMWLHTHIIGIIFWIAHVHMERGHFLRFSSLKWMKCILNSMKLRFPLFFLINTS